jgi:hypothetical protein
MARCALSYSCSLLIVGIAINCLGGVSVQQNRLTLAGASLRVAPQETESAASLWLKAKAAMDQGNFTESRRLLRLAVQPCGSIWE